LRPSGIAALYAAASQRNHHPGVFAMKENTVSNSKRRVAAMF
jgi:hypothetical protein